MTYRIRRIEAGDYAHLPEIYREAITGTARHHYSDEQTKVWLQRTPSVFAFAEAFEDGRHGFVVEGEGGVPLGFADVEQDGHIGWFYCRPALSGTGMAVRLLLVIEAVAQKQGISRLFVEASETARGFFLRNGFREDLRRDFDISGVAIHNYAMSKTLG